jgi:predicted hydrocarbon binding protein
MSAVAITDKENYFQKVKEALIERGWVEDITFDGNNITAKGSIEVSPSEEATCHRLRGILRHIYQTYTNERLYCSETQCASTGGEACVFKIESMD